jgi:hypothetical protein
VDLTDSPDSHNSMWSAETLVRPTDDTESVHSVFSAPTASPPSPLTPPSPLVVPGVPRRRVHPVPGVIYRRRPLAFQPPAPVGEPALAPTRVLRSARPPTRVPQSVNRRLPGARVLRSNTARRTQYAESTGQSFARTRTRAEINAGRNLSTGTSAPSRVVRHTQVRLPDQPPGEPPPEKTLNRLSPQREQDEEAFTTEYYKRLQVVRPPAVPRAFLSWNMEGLRQRMENATSMAYFVKFALAQTPFSADTATLSPREGTVGPASR